MQSTAYTDSTTSIPHAQINLNKSVFELNPLNTWFTGQKYLPQVPLSTRCEYGTKGGGVVSTYKIPNVTSLNGFTSLYSPNFCKGVR